MIIVERRKYFGPLHTFPFFYSTVWHTRYVPFCFLFSLWELWFPLLLIYAKIVHSGGIWWHFILYKICMGVSDQNEKNQLQRCRSSSCQDEAIIIAYEMLLSRMKLPPCSSILFCLLMKKLKNHEGFKVSYR